MRTQEEILERIKSADDLFGTQIADLVNYLDWDNRKQFLKDEYVAKVESGEEEKLPTHTNPKQEILDYLEFAYGKAHGQRGLSAGRSLLHFKTWIWLDDEKFYNEILPFINDYTEYGLPALDRISAHYGWVSAHM